MENDLTELEISTIEYACERDRRKKTGSVDDLQIHLKMSNQEAREAVKGLRDKGYISLAPNPRYFTLTKEGLKLCKAIEAKANNQKQNVNIIFNIATTNGGGIVGQIGQGSQVTVSRSSPAPSTEAPQTDLILDALATRRGPHLEYELFNVCVSIRNKSEKTFALNSLEVLKPTGARAGTSIYEFRGIVVLGGPDPSLYVPSTNICKIDQRLQSGERKETEFFCALPASAAAVGEALVMALNANSAHGDIQQIFTLILP